MSVESAPLRVAVGLGGWQPSLEITGKADHYNISSVLSSLDRLAAEGDCCVSLDLSGLEIGDPVAVERLACSACLLKEQGKRLHLAGPSDELIGLIQDLGLSELFCTAQGACRECEPQARLADIANWSGDAFRFASSVDCCRNARNRIDQMAEGAGFGKSDREDVMLAVGEAVANAIQHGQNGDGPDSFSVSCLASPGRLCILVSDHGHGFDPDALPPIEDITFMERGRGVHCMRAVMDELTFHFGGGTTVRMVKYAGNWGSGDGGREPGKGT